MSAYDYPLPPEQIAAEQQVVEAEKDLRENFYFSTGSTKISCRRCGTEQDIPNETIEAMREYRCPECNHRMTDRELARLKMHYYFMVWDSLNRTPPFPPFTPRFDYDICLNPHLEKRNETAE